MFPGKAIGLAYPMGRIKNGVTSKVLGKTAGYIFNGLQAEFPGGAADRASSQCRSEFHKWRCRQKFSGDAANEAGIEIHKRAKSKVPWCGHRPRFTNAVTGRVYCESIGLASPYES